MFLPKSRIPTFGPILHLTRVARANGTARWNGRASFEMEADAGCRTSPASSFQNHVGIEGYAKDAKMENFEFRPFLPAFLQPFY